jgi:hypothetical protein
MKKVVHRPARASSAPQEEVVSFIPAIVRELQQSPKPLRSEDLVRRVVASATAPFQGSNVRREIQILIFEGSVQFSDDGRYLRLSQQGIEFAEAIGIPRNETS